MSVVAAQLIAQVTVQGDVEAKQRLQSVGESANTTGSGLKSALGNALSFATGMGVYNLAASAVSGLKDQFVDTIKVAMQHQDVMSQTNQVVKSTHDVSGMTATAVDNLASSLSHVTKFSDDTIQSGENLLMTFTGIGKQVFPQATSAMLDLSQATGQSMSSSAMQLGKALNDPLTGMAALQRVGVTFSDTEKTQIKTMMAHNDVIGAQKVMLNELSTEFGGSATAAGKTFSGQLAILKNDFDDIKQKIGMAIIPILTQLLGVVTSDVLPSFDKLGGVVSNVAHYFSLFDLSPITHAWAQLTDSVKGSLAPLGGAGDAFKSLAPFVNTLRNGFSQLVVSGIKDVSGIIEKIAEAINKLTGNDKSDTLLIKSAEGMSKLLEVTGPVAYSLKDVVDRAMAMKDGLSRVADGASKLTGFLSGIKDGIKEVATVIGNLSPGVNLFEALSSHAQELGKWFQTSVIPAFNQAKPGFDQLIKAGQQLWPVIQQISDVVHNTFQKAFDALLPVIMKAIPIIIQIAGVIADVLGRAIQFLSPYVVQATKAVGDFAVQIAQRVAPIISQWFDSLKTGLDFFQKNWTTIWGAIGPFVKGVWDMIVGTIQIAWAIVSGIIKIGLDLLSGNWKQAWTDLQTMLKGVWDGIKTYLQGMWEIIKGIFSAAWAAIQAIFAPIGQWFQARWDEVTSGVVNFKNGVIGHFNELRSGAGGIFRSLVDDIISWLNDGITAVENFVNFFGTAINDLADKLGGHDPVARISLGRIPAYAEGTAGHPGGPAIVGERGPELVMLPKGASVLPNDQTTKLLAQMGVPGYASGIGNALGDIGSLISGGASAALNNVLGALHVSLSLPSGLSTLSVDIVNTVKGYATDFIKGLLSQASKSISSAGGGSAGKGEAVSVPGSVADWLTAAMSLTGVPGNWLSALETIAMSESGGNPDAINNTDINAQEGHPSQGLMQTIPSTFAAYMVAGHGNILNPIDNAAAAINYIKAVYGSVFNVPGIRSIASGGGYVGYANGTDNAPGGMAWVGENGPELLNVPQGSQIIPNNKAGSWGSNLVKTFADSITNASHLASEAASTVIDGVADYMAFYSPAKKGAGSTAHLWGGNLVTQFANDIKAKTAQAQLAAESMMTAVVNAITNTKTQLDLDVISGNKTGQKADRSALSNLDAQLNAYENIAKKAGYKISSNNATNPINFGGQQQDQIDALRAVSQFAADIKASTTTSQAQANTIYGNLLKTLDGFGSKIATAQLQGNTALVATLQQQQTTAQQELTVLQYSAQAAKLTVDANNFKNPLSGFSFPTNLGNSKVNAQFSGDLQKQTETSLADASKMFTQYLSAIYNDSVAATKAKLAHNTTLVRKDLAKEAADTSQLHGFEALLSNLGYKYSSTNYLNPINFSSATGASGSSGTSSGSGGGSSTSTSDAAITALTGALTQVNSTFTGFGKDFSMFTNISNRMAADIDRVSQNVITITNHITQAKPTQIILQLDGRTIGTGLMPYIASSLQQSVRTNFR